MIEIQSAFAHSPKQDFPLKIDPADGQTLLLADPSQTEHPKGYIKPIVRFEFRARGAHLQAENIR